MPTKYIVIAVAAVVILGGAYFLLSKPASSQNTAQGTQTGTQAGAQNTVQPAGGEGAFSGSLAELIGRGGDWKCTFGAQGNGYSSSGTTYVSGGKMRSDFSSQIQQVKQAVDSHMIQDGGFVYVWTSLAAQGFKAKATLGSKDATAQFGKQGVNIDQKYNYNCSPWKVDASLFALPKGITFVGQ